LACVARENQEGHNGRRKLEDAGHTEQYLKLALAQAIDLAGDILRLDAPKMLLNVHFG
jgi:hypothetical protein